MISPKVYQVQSLASFCCPVLPPYCNLSVFSQALHPLFSYHKHCCLCRYQIQFRLLLLSQHSYSVSLLSYLYHPHLKLPHLSVLTKTVPPHPILSFLATFCSICIFFLFLLLWNVPLAIIGSCSILLLKLELSCLTDFYCLHFRHYLQNHHPLLNDC